MNKRLKKILVSLLAITFVFSTLTMIVSADNTDGSNTITPHSYYSGMAPRMPNPVPARGNEPRNALVYCDDYKL